MFKKTHTSSSVYFWFSSPIFMLNANRTCYWGNNCSRQRIVACKERRVKKVDIHTYRKETDHDWVRFFFFLKNKTGFHRLLLLHWRIIYISYPVSHQRRIWCYCGGGEMSLPVCVYSDLKTLITNECVIMSGPSPSYESYESPPSLMIYQLSRSFFLSTSSIPVIKGWVHTQKSEYVRSS